MKSSRELLAKAGMREPLPIESGHSLQKIVERHASTIENDVVSAILQIDPESLPLAVYMLLHKEDHSGKSAVPDLCPSGLRDLFDLLLSCGVEIGLRLAGDGDGSQLWKN
jgi:hypothetical protein